MKIKKTLFILLMITTCLDLLCNLVYPPTHLYKELIISNASNILLVLIIATQNYVLDKRVAENKHLEDSLNQALKELDGD